MRLRRHCGAQAHLHIARGVAGLVAMAGELAEARGEGDLLQIVERLPAKHQHRMLVPRGLDGPPVRIVERLRQIDAAHFGAKRGGELAESHRRRSTRSSNKASERSYSST